VRGSYLNIELRQRSELAAVASRQRNGPAADRNPPLEKKPSLPANSAAPGDGGSSCAQMAAPANSVYANVNLRIHNTSSQYLHGV
jgi:hypothetical protein